MQKKTGLFSNFSGEKPYKYFKPKMNNTIYREFFKGIQVLKWFTLGYKISKL